jgi:hypothetical protein
MKRLTLHRIASSLHRFIASVAQLWRLPHFIACNPKLNLTGPAALQGVPL